MGGCLCGRRKDGRILLLGLDGVGKTTILRKLKSGVNAEIDPPGQTVGFNLESIYHKKRQYCIWDVSGKDKSRPIWNRYFSDTLALIWVVDSTDNERLHLCRQEFHKLMREPELSKAIVLVYLNKQDLHNALPPAAITDTLDLQDMLKKRAWFLQPCSATEGEGLVEGFTWLTTNL